MAQYAGITPISNRTYVITPADNSYILDMGPGGTSSSVATMVIQFNPSGDSDYQVIVMGKVWGEAARLLNVPFVPIPYRRVTLANVASDYAIVSAPVTGASLIQVPANWAIGLAVITTVGTCQVASWPLQGSSNP